MIDGGGPFTFVDTRKLYCSCLSIVCFANAICATVSPAELMNTAERGGQISVKGRKTEMCRLAKLVHLVQHGCSSHPLCKVD